MNRIFSIAFLVLLIGCNNEEPASVTLDSDSIKPSPSLFTLLSKEESGFYFMNEVKQSEAFNVITYENFYNGGGVGAGDINNDGLPDLFLTGNTFGGRLYLNKGGMKFEQISESANIFIQGFTTDVSFVDINNDGYQDIYLCRSLVGETEYRENILYINNKDNTFTNKAKEYGIADAGYSNQSVFFDYDNDGDLDLYVMNHRSDFHNAFSIYDTKEAKGNINPGDMFWKDEFADKLYRNNGNQTFTDVSKQAGIINNDFSLSAVPADLNGDGWMDLYIANDFSSKDHAYINQGNGTFKDELETRFGHIPLSSMGMDIADYNNDGYPDVVNLDMMPENNYRQKQLKGSVSYDKYHLAADFGHYHQVARNMLHLNNGDGTFSEIGQLANMAYTDWSWGSLFADLDNDGWQDLYITNGHYKDITDLDYLKYRSMDAVKAAGGNDHVKPMDLINLMTSTKIRNYAFSNNKDLQFIDKTKEWGLDQLSHSNGAAYADLDLDGDLDLVVNNFNQEAFLYRNNSRELNNSNYLSVSLKGADGNNQGFGSKIKIKSKTGSQYREVTPYRGFLSSVDPNLHFGLGNDTEILELEITWPNHKSQTLKNIKANQHIVLNISDANEIHQQNQPEKNIFLHPIKQIIAYTHKENPFVDFKQEPLLEHFLSNRGPVAAKSDVNNDGLDDIYIGGSTGFEGKLFIQQKDGKFKEKNINDFTNDKQYEDGGCAFFDANRDGFPDLYVSSGSNEFRDNKMYQDRLYINNGKGDFVKSSSLPQILNSTSCVLPFDYDNDGDLDLFVGGFVKPNSYPEAGKSWLLQNNNGVFKDKSDLLPQKGDLGIINDVSILDDNSLIVVGEWTDIMVLKKDNNGRYEIIKNNGLQNTGGWWNCINTNDFDGDGDIDVIVGNRGLNSMFKAAVEYPAEIYYGDFDNNGDLDAIPCYYYPKDGKYYPKHNLDQMFMQMKTVRKKFHSYDSYSKAELEEIIPSSAKKKSAHYFESVYLENLGNGKMRIKPLPIEAQFSYVQDILAKDLNGDNKKDIIIVGNNYGVDVEMGKSDASNGLVLLFEDGNFKPINTIKSGLHTNSADARQIIELNNNKILILNNNQPAQSYSFK